jgi:hypothetical protein
LNDQEALLFFVYERWRQRWWHLNPPWGAYAWQLPFDPMASPWHWDRHTLLSGLLVGVGGLLEYVRSGGLPRLGVHLGMAAAFPLTASKIHNPETREMGFIASACLNAAVGGYGAYQVRLTKGNQLSAFLVSDISCPCLCHVDTVFYPTSPPGPVGLLSHVCAMLAVELDSRSQFLAIQPGQEKTWWPATAHSCLQGSADASILRVRAP